MGKNKWKKHGIWTLFTQYEDPVTLYLREKSLDINNILRKGFIAFNNAARYSAHELFWTFFYPNTTISNKPKNSIRLFLNTGFFLKEALVGNAW